MHRLLLLQKSFNYLKTKQRNPIKLSACSREREAITDSLLSYFRFCSSKRKSTTKIPTIGKNQKRKSVPTTTAINYIWYGKAIVYMQNRKKKYAPGSCSGAMKPKTWALGKYQISRLWWLFAAKTTARLTNFAFWLAHKLRDATSQTQKWGILKYYMYCLNRCNLVAQKSAARWHGQFVTIIAFLGFQMRQGFNTWNCSSSSA